MDPFFAPQQWSIPEADLATGWPAVPWLQYPMMPFPMVDQPFMQQPQQQGEESQLTELQPLTDLHSYPLPFPVPDMPAENLLPTPPPSSPSNSSGNSYEVPFAMPPLQFNQEPFLTHCVPDEPSEYTPLPKGKRKAEKRQSQRGTKRKRAEDGEDREVKKQCPPPPTIPTAVPPVTSIFYKVVGRLALVGFQKTYTVGSDEIFRRTSLPECLNRSHLGPLLKRGKVKGCGDEMQQLLDRCGLTASNMINRKRYPLTALSSLLEEEMVQFCADHRELASTHFPSVPLARLIIRSFQTPTDLAAAAAEVKVAKSTMDKALSVLDQWTDGGWGVGTATIMASPLGPFSLATHGLGVDEARLFFSLFSRFLAHLDQECEAHLRTVRAALSRNPQAMLANQFPAGMELPSLPHGQLYKPSIEEDARESSSFTEIAGRLTLNNKKFNVTVGELMRRIRAPESLNLSLLGGIVRKGKTKHNGLELKHLLSEHGVEIDTGRRKGAPVTCFTALLEAEALTLVNDMKEEVNRSFPFAPLFDEIVALAGAPTPQERHTLNNGFAAISRIANSLSEAVLSMRLPIAERIPHKVQDTAYLMLPYSSLTHGYGPDACHSWIIHIRNLFGIAIKPEDD